MLLHKLNAILELQGVSKTLDIKRSQPKLIPIGDRRCGRIVGNPNLFAPDVVLLPTQRSSKKRCSRLGSFFG